MLFAAYLITAKFGLGFDAVSGFATLVWPPAGIALAALLIWGLGLWPGIFLGAFLINLITGAPVPVALAMAMGNTLEAILAVYLLKRLINFEPSLNKLSDVFGLIIIGGLFLPVVAATVGTSSLFLAGMIKFNAYLPTWLAWWSGDVLGILIITPLLLVIKESWPFRFSFRQLVEAALALLFLIFSCLLIFNSPFLGFDPNILPVTYAVAPALFWAALRFGKLGAVISVFVLATISIWGTYLGLGPFARESLSHSLTFLQGFLGTMSAVFLIIAAMNEQLKMKISGQEKTLYLRNEQLEKDRMKDEIMLESIGEGLIVLDNQGKIILMNKQAEIMLGWEFKDTADKDFMEVFPLEDETGKPISLKDRPSQVPLDFGAKASAKRYYAIKKNKTRFPIEMTVTSLLVNGQITGAIDIFRDITEEDKLQHQKKEQLVHKIQMEKKEREFLSMASHQLMTPLALIEGSISMAISGKYGKLSQETKDLLTQSLSGSKRMVNLIKTLLTTSRVESGSVKIDKKDFNLTPLLLEVYKDFMDSAKQKNLKLELKKPSEDLVAFADVNFTREILANLIDNAIKYTDNGSILITAEKNSDLARVSIEDTGVGIDENSLPHIFEKFYMSENWIEKQGQSHGLGLYISKLLLELMDGKITVQSKLGKGTTISFTLPLDKKR